MRFIAYLLIVSYVRAVGLGKKQIPTQEIQSDEIPTEEIPTEEIPTEEIPGEEIPGEEIPGEESSTEDSTDVPEVSARAEYLQKQYQRIIQDLNDHHDYTLGFYLSVADGGDVAMAVNRELVDIAQSRLKKALERFKNTKDTIAQMINVPIEAFHQEYTAMERALVAKEHALDTHSQIMAKSQENK